MIKGLFIFDLDSRSLTQNSWLRLNILNSYSRFLTPTQNSCLILEIIDSDQGLLDLIFKGRIVKRFSNIILLRHGHWGTFPTCLLVFLVHSHLVSCIFLCINFRKTKDELSIPESGLSSDRKLHCSIWAQSRARTQTRKSSGLDLNFRFSKIYA